MTINYFFHDLSVGWAVPLPWVSLWDAWKVQNIFTHINGSWCWLLPGALVGLQPEALLHVGLSMWRLTFSWRMVAGVMQEQFKSTSLSVSKHTLSLHCWVFLMSCWSKPFRWTTSASVWVETRKGWVLGGVGHCDPWNSSLLWTFYNIKWDRRWIMVFNAYSWQLVKKPEWNFCEGSVDSFLHIA